jgi:V-type H+-transporting ATPase subunit H
VLAVLVQGTSPNKADVAVQCLEALLARPECRQAVWAIPGIITGYVKPTLLLRVLIAYVLFCRFVEILKHKPGPQMSYQVAFCLWLLSFEQNVAEQMNKSVLFTLSCKIPLTLIDTENTTSYHF